MSVFYHSGDAGDVLASLPAIRQLGGGQIVIGPHVGSGQPREPMTPARFNFIKPLLASQYYIGSASYEYFSKRVTHDISKFRVDAPLIHGESLAHWQARQVGIEPKDLNVAPWLGCEPSKETNGKVVIARSSRYHVQQFPWRHLVHQHAGRMLFLGLPDE